MTEEGRRAHGGVLAHVRTWHVCVCVSEVGMGVYAMIFNVRT